MKTLILVRHAKAEDPTGKGDDFDRILTKEGERDAASMGERLRSMKINPSVIVSSSAERAIGTARIIQKRIQHTKHILLEKAIYEADVSSLMDVVWELSEDAISAMLVGHNPGFTDLLHHLCETNIENIPKGGVAGIRIDTDTWASISKKSGTLLFFDSPKNK